MNFLRTALAQILVFAFLFSFAHVFCACVFEWIAHWLFSSILFNLHKSGDFLFFLMVDF